MTGILAACRGLIAVSRELGSLGLSGSFDTHVAVKQDACGIHYA
jgi:hypothetical protein